VALWAANDGDWVVLAQTSEVLTRFDVTYVTRTLSPLATPDAIAGCVAEAEERGVVVFIASAGGGVSLAATVTVHTMRPVLAVPLESPLLRGLDALVASVQLPVGLPVGTLAIGKAGATNAGLMAIAILSGQRPDLRAALHRFRTDQTAQVMQAQLP
jgi:5-(carboxyamino)imidazole ribonucleotide mutase